MHNQTGYENYGDYAKAGYYSYTRLQTTGEIEIDGNSISVAGELWYDRQWNCMGVYHKKVGWDWMAIQFEEPRAELMLYMLHNFENDKKTIYGGTLYTENEENISLKNSEIEIKPSGYWQSPHSDIWYPTAWKISIPNHQLEIDVNALIEDQELYIKYGLLNMHYWEGMSTAKGYYNQKPIKGNAYVEMTNRKLHGSPKLEDLSLNQRK
jgi:predicted secreted hydrolase